MGGTRQTIGCGSQAVIEDISGIPVNSGNETSRMIRDTRPNAPSFQVNFRGGHARNGKSFRLTATPAACEPMNVGLTIAPTPLALGYTSRGGD